MAKYTLSQRNAVAKSQGFRNYYEKRTALNYARKGPYSGMFRDVTGVEKINARNVTHLNLVRLFYRGYKLDPDNYSFDSDKAKFLELSAEVTSDEDVVSNASAHSAWLFAKVRI